jgi:hypothetical protein
LRALGDAPATVNAVVEALADCTSPEAPALLEGSRRIEVLRVGYAKHDLE